MAAQTTLHVAHEVDQRRSRATAGYVEAVQSPSRPRERVRRSAAKA
jgi:hypothetical protein